MNHAQGAPGRTDRTIRAARTCVACLIVCLLLPGASALSQTPGIAAADGQDALPVQRDYPAPEAAIDALMAAVQADDERALIEVLGPDEPKLMRSGDPVADRRARLRLIDAYNRSHRIEVESPTLANLVVGPEDWSLPIPLVRDRDRWHFDTQASEQKILDRRIGRNELNVIEVCRAFVSAEREYASSDALGGRLHEFAAKFESAPGKHDGLYWKATADEQQSPLGPLVAHARAEGYDGKEREFRQEPYHGYYFRILTRQGPHAQGGSRNYVVSGHLSGGFALLAFPAKWGNSGIMTFQVNESGIVFQRNLGPDTRKLADTIVQYDPDSSWSAP